jgi:hypothetical protein
MVLRARPSAEVDALVEDRGVALGPKVLQEIPIVPEFWVIFYRTYVF